MITLNDFNTNLSQLRKVPKKPIKSGKIDKKKLADSIEKTKKFLEELHSDPEYKRLIKLV